MTGIDRRTMLAGTAAAGLVAAAPALAAAPAAAGPMLFIYDERFAASRLEAEKVRARGGIALDPRQRDLGLAWREDIPRLLARAGGTIGGMTLWSDRFICETFARDHGLALAMARPVEEARGGAPGLGEWVLA